MVHSITGLSIVVLGCAGALAGLVDSIAGGGGLIALPALLLAGIPPTMTLGTNKMQSAVGEMIAFIHFVKRGLINFKSIIPGLIVVFITASLGGLSVQHIHPTLLNKIIPVLLLVVLAYFIFSSHLQINTTKPKIKPWQFYLTVGSVIAFYNGFLGPGTGSFWVVSMMYFLGMTVQRATVQMKPLNFIGNVSSLIWFIINGHIDYLVVFSMSTGQIIGSLIGSKLVVDKGAQIIRPFFITVVALMLIRSSFNAFIVHSVN